MKQIRQLHLYLGTLFAPMIIFFAFSGALQTFQWHEKGKSATYRPPAWIVTLAQIHKNERMAQADGKSVALRWFIMVMSVGLIITTLLGIYMAFKFNRDRRIIWGLMGLGFIIPVAALLFH